MACDLQAVVKLVITFVLFFSLTSISIIIASIVTSNRLPRHHAFRRLIGELFIPASDTAVISGKHIGLKAWLSGIAHKFIVKAYNYSLFVDQWRDWSANLDVSIDLLQFLVSFLLLYDACALLLSLHIAQNDFLLYLSSFSAYLSHFCYFLSFNSQRMSW